MEKSRLKALKSLILISSIVLTSFYANAQMECRSMLGAHLTPFKEGSSILWGLEGTMAPGMMTSPFTDQDKTKLNGGMLLGALDFGFSQNNHIYIEGGLKNWKNSKFVNDTSSLSRKIGMRQVFYSYSGESIKVKIGLQETRLGDFLLLDERMMGISVDKNLGAFTINVRGGTVIDNFARMGKFCANRHLYGIINPNYTPGIGEKGGETNLAGFVINWNPHYVEPEETTAPADEFESTDEFENTDEFHENHDFNEFGNADEFADESESKPKQKISITNVGFLLHNEFGAEAYIPNHKLYTGILADIDLPNDFYLQASSIYQNMLHQNTLVSIVKFGKSKTWDNASNTKISGAYIGKYDFDANAFFQPLFSNLFLGEIMRLDAMEFPLWQMAIKHRFPGDLKLHVAVKAVAQIEDAKTNEQNIELGMMAFDNHLKVTLIGSRVETQALPNEFYMGRVELRLAF